MKEKEKDYEVSVDYEKEELKDLTQEQIKELAIQRNKEALERYLKNKNQ